MYGWALHQNYLWVYIQLFVLRQSVKLKNVFLWLVMIECQRPTSVVISGSIMFSLHAHSVANNHASVQCGFSPIVEFLNYLRFGQITGGTASGVELWYIPLMRS